MTDYLQALNCYLNGKSRVDGWKEVFIASWFEPVINVMKQIAIEGARNSPNIDQNKLMGMLSPEAQQRLRGE